MAGNEFEPLDPDPGEMVARQEIQGNLAGQVGHHPHGREKKKVVRHCSFSSFPLPREKPFSERHRGSSSFVAPSSEAG